MALDHEVMTSPTSLKPSYNVSHLKNMLAITIKLNNTNYLLWAQSFIMFVISRKKKKHIFMTLPLNLLATMIRQQWTLVL